MKVYSLNFLVDFILWSILFQDRLGWAGTKPEKFRFVFHITETHLELSIQSVILPCSPNSPSVGKQLHSWITDFLSPRRQRVDFNGILSSLPVMLQCPRNSVLDPVLLLQLWKFTKHHTGSLEISYFDKYVFQLRIPH